jgi:hypothetical protein
MASARYRIDKSEGFVKQHSCAAVLSRVRLPEKVEDRDSANLTLNHCTVDLRSTNHRFGLNCGHDYSMRTFRPLRNARAPNQRLDLACADPGHPRAALDANDLWIPDLGA